MPTGDATNMNGYDAIAQMLKQEGFEWLACFPANPLIEAVAKAGIRPIVFRQERGGIMAADGYSRIMAARGKYGVFACQGGPGIENAFGGFAQAWADGVPILFIPDGPGTNKADIKPYFSGPANYEHITKWAVSITSGDRIPALMRRAMTALKNGRPGPVMLEMHRDAMQGEIASLDGFTISEQYRTVPSVGDIQEAARRLVEAKKPVIWAGQGVLYSGATAELKELAELAQIPVITTMPGKSAIDERHPLSLGAANRTAPKPVWTWLKESDVLFAIGASLTKTNYGIDIPAGKTIIHSTNNVEDVAKEYPTEVGLVGDSRETLRLMIDAVRDLIGDSRSKDTAVREAVAQVRKEWLDEWKPLLNSNMEPINPYRLVNEINKAVDHEKTIMTHDAGHPRDQLMPFYTATLPHSYVGWGKTTHLGYGIGLMIGAKMAHPEKFCMNFMGDAAFGMAGLDIETSVRSGNPITTIVLDNGTMGGYNRSLPTAMEQFGAGKMTGNYAMIAEGLGATGITVDKPEGIGPAIKQAQRLNSEGKSALIAVKTQQELKFSVYAD
ncbi:MAG: thiamine pyrophosphate-requiring protein [Chloroflexi bacterium]|nr:thiamine pyrophosphate-requiring protein [Chloroflexota bacterium]